MKTSRLTALACALALSPPLADSRGNPRLRTFSFPLGTHRHSGGSHGSRTHTLATASFDKNVRLFDLATGKELRAYAGEQGHKGQVLAVAFSAKGDQIATGATDNTARVWDVPVNVPVKTYATSGVATRVVVSAADGKTFAVAGADGVVKVFPAGEEKGAIELKGHTGAVTQLGLSGTTWVTTGADKTIRFWDATGKQTTSYSLGTADLTGLAVGPSVFTTHADNVLRQWQLPPQPTRAFPVLKDSVTAFAASADGNTVLYATADKVVTLGSVSNNQAAGTFAGAKSAVAAVALSPDIATVVAGGTDGSVILWDRQGKVKGELTARGRRHERRVPPRAADPLHRGRGRTREGLESSHRPQAAEGKSRQARDQGTHRLGPRGTRSPHDRASHHERGRQARAVLGSTKPDKPVKEIGPLESGGCAHLARDGTLLAGASGKDVILWNAADGKDAASSLKARMCWA